MAYWYLLYLVKNFPKTLILKAAHFLDEKNRSEKISQNRLILHDQVMNQIMKKMSKGFSIDI